MAAKQKSGRAEVRWRALIGEQERSRLPVREFARRRGLSAATLYWWRSRLSRRVGNRQRPKLAAVQLIGAGAGVGPEQARGFELELSRGRRLYVPTHFDAEALSRLIVAVERAC